MRIRIADSEFPLSRRCPLDQISYSLWLQTMGKFSITHYYLVHLQFLGYRYHGWQKQPGQKTVELMVEKTMMFVLGHERFRILGASRTDAKVSANHFVFELFLDGAQKISQLKDEINRNLPGDIRVTAIEKTTADFNILQAPKVKEYVYYFSSGKKKHPFCAPFMVCFEGVLDIREMMEGAKLFQGKHNFIQYCTKPGKDTQLNREIFLAQIETNRDFSAVFFPESSHLLRIRAKGFLRNQIRLIMAQLVCLGRGEISVEKIRKSLTGRDISPLRHIAPASGLVLNKIEFNRSL